MKEHPKYKGYFITEDGEVFSNKQGVLKKITPYKNRRGYLTVRLCPKPYTQYRTGIHKLVAETYLDNPNNYPQVDHIDENKLNNNISNLQWIDNQRNCEKSFCKIIWIIENINTKKIMEVSNLSKFCRENNLSSGTLQQTYSNNNYKSRRNHHKNFRIISKIV